MYFTLLNLILNKFALSTYVQNFKTHTIHLLISLKKDSETIEMITVQYDSITIGKLILSCIDALTVLCWDFYSIFSHLSRFSSLSDIQLSHKLVTVHRKPYFWLQDLLLIVYLSPMCLEYRRWTPANRAKGTPIGMSEISHLLFQLIFQMILMLYFNTWARLLNVNLLHLQITCITTFTILQIEPTK